MRKNRKLLELDVIRYLYGEMDAAESEKFESALGRKRWLRKEISGQLDMKEMLDDTLLAPSDKVVKKVMAFVNSTNQKDHSRSAPLRKKGC